MSSTHSSNSGPNNISASEMEFINSAQKFLENPSLLLKIANMIGKPIDRGLKFLPAVVQDKIQHAVKLSLQKGLAVVTKSVKPMAQQTFSEAIQTNKKNGLLHSAATFGTGALGGFFGAASLPIELPVTTAIILRSIVSTARDFGLDVSDPEVQLECLYVLSLGAANAKSADTLDSAYWTSRLAFTDLIRHAARELEKGTAPFIVRFLAQIAGRFEMVVSEKVLAELVPIVGAVGGGLLNSAFTDHFNTAARFHFGLRALEIKYGEREIHEMYEQARNPA